MLPEIVKTPLKEHLQRVRAVHDRDSADGYGRVHMPHGLARKYPNAAAEWRWQWVFPQENRWEDTKTGEQGRHHVHETIFQREIGRTASSVIWPPTISASSAVDDK